MLIFWLVALTFLESLITGHKTTKNAELRSVGLYPWRSLWIVPRIMPPLFNPIVRLTSEVIWPPRREKQTHFAQQLDSLSILVNAQQWIWDDWIYQIHGKKLSTPKTVVNHGLSWFIIIFLNFDMALDPQAPDIPNFWFLNFEIRMRMAQKYPPQQNG